MPVVSFGGIIAAISSCVCPVLALPVGIPRYRYSGIPTSFVHYPGIECRSVLSVDSEFHPKPDYVHDKERKLRLLCLFRRLVIGI